MGAFAEFERNIIKKRQLEGIEKAKAKIDLNVRNFLNAILEL